MLSRAEADGGWPVIVCVNDKLLHPEPESEGGTFSLFSPQFPRPDSQAWAWLPEPPLLAHLKDTPQSPGLPASHWPVSTESQIC